MTHPLGDLATIYAGLATTRHLSDHAPELAIISVADLDGYGGVSPSDALERLRLEPGPSLQGYRAQVGDVLLTGRGTLLKAALVGPETAGAVVSGNLIGIRVDPARMLPGALIAWLCTSGGQAALTARVQATSGLIALTTALVRALPVPVPSLEVQSRAAALFEATRVSYTLAVRAADARRKLGLAAVAPLFRVGVAP